MSDASSGPLDELLEELDLSCRQFVWAKLKLELDGSAETLPILDHYLASARVDLAAGPHAGELVVQAVGAYFGNVVAATIEGFWRTPTPRVEDAVICARPAYLAINPFGVAHDVLNRSTRHQGPSSELRVDPSQRELIEQRLARLPPPDEDEYFTLSARLEVLEITLAALREQGHAQGRQERTLLASDYDDL
jgi:hypothetical protein